MEYYQKIRNVREDLDIKQYQFAKKIDVSAKAYNLYENGLRSIPYDTLNKILEVLELSLDYILDFSNQKNYSNLKPINLDILCQNLKFYRKKMHYSQEKMASLLNCNQQTLSEYEHGNIKIPIPSLKKFCEIVNISADTLTGRTNKIIKISKVHQ